MGTLCIYYKTENVALQQEGRCKQEEVVYCLRFRKLFNQLVIGGATSFVCLAKDVLLYQRLDVTQCRVL